jgi:hypothetical protein
VEGKKEQKGRNQKRQKGKKNRDRGQGTTKGDYGIRKELIKRLKSD